MSEAIPGTRPRGKISPEKNSTAAPAQNDSFHSTTQQAFSEKSSTNCAAKNVLTSEEKNFNSARREYFSALLPSFGNGLVKILRASNNLKRDFAEEWKKKNS